MSWNNKVGYIFLSRFMAKGITLESEDEIAFKSRFEDGLFNIENEQLTMIARAETDGVIEAINEYVIMLWQDYALADDATLDNRAKELKDYLLSEFKEVKQ